MALTSGQWNKIQASLPREDRTSYADYLAASAPAPTPTPTGGYATAITSPKTPVATWAKSGTVNTLQGPVDVDANGRAADGSLPISSTADAAPTPTKTATKTITNADGTITTTYSDGTSTTTGTPTGGISQADIDKAVKANDATWQAKFDALQQSNKDTLRANTTTALADFTASLSAAGLGGLVSTLNTWITQDKTAAQIAIDIKSEQVYKDRFPGMTALSKAGRAVSEAAYISMERGYQQVLGAYGLDTSVFGTTAKLGEYIAGEVSPVEFESRVQIAADRVNKNPDVIAALQDYYGVTKGAATAWLLDPNLGMDVVKKEARAAEIGAAASAAGFEEFAGKANKGVAESFINASGTQDLQSLKTEFGKARLLADTQGRLSQIEGDMGYTDLNAVTAVIGQNQQELLESQRRAMREQARFAGSAGISASSLKTQSGI